MERFVNRFNTEKTEIIEVRMGFKQRAVIVSFGSNEEYLFRSEKGVILSLDARIPKPQELYHDVAYSRFADMLDWDVALPVWPFELPVLGNNAKERGVIRPFFRDALSYQPYQLNLEFFNKEFEFWAKVAILDYILGVSDRSYNDILRIDNHHRVADSGLSFVEGEKFCLVGNSIVRKALAGQSIPHQLMTDLSNINWQNVYASTNGLVEKDKVVWVKKRAEIIIENCAII